MGKMEESFDESPFPNIDIDDPAFKAWGDLNSRAPTPSDMFDMKDICRGYSGNKEKKLPVQYNRWTRCYEIERLKTVRLPLPEDVSEQDFLVFKVVPFSVSNRHILTTCKAHQEENKIAEGPPFRIIYPQDTEAYSDEQGTSYYKVSNLGKYSNLEVKFFCNGTEEHNYGKKEDNRFWKFLISGVRNMRCFEQSIPIQVMQQLRDPDRRNVQFRREKLMNSNDMRAPKKRKIKKELVAVDLQYSPIVSANFSKEKGMKHPDRVQEFQQLGPKRQQLLKFYEERQVEKKANFMKKLGIMTEDDASAVLRTFITFPDSI